ncbi:MAG: hypothetical protein ABFS32_15570 [Bacteroidota bacterium]
MKRHYSIIILLILALVFESCKSGKKAFEHGNYYQSVLQSAQKLRKSPNNKKAAESLEQAYPLALKTIELSNDNLMLSNSSDKWKKILANYNMVNNMYEQILRSPAALKVVPQPKNYYAKMDEVKKNAAEETYLVGLDFLKKNTREDAKLAYAKFEEAQSFVANYKDTNEKMEEARIMATLFVMVKQDALPEAFAVSGNYFRNKVDEFLHSKEIQRSFVEFYNPDEMVKLGMQPDHVVTIRYQDFNIGNVYMRELVEQVTKDSVVIARIKNPAFTGSGGTVAPDQTQGDVTIESGQVKITICHDGQTIKVDQASLQTHLDHGDYVGACKTGGEQPPVDPTPPPPPPTDDKLPGDDTNPTPTNLDNPTVPEWLNIYATVKATLTVYEKTITSSAKMSLTISEGPNNRVLKEDVFPAEHVWVSKWGHFNGDERALSAEQLEITKQKEQPAPSRDEIFNLLSEYFYNDVTRNIQAFYENY